MIYFQAKPKTAVPGDSSTQFFPAPAGVPITILASTEVC